MRFTEYVLLMLTLALMIIGCPGGIEMGYLDDDTEGDDDDITWPGDDDSATDDDTADDDTSGDDDDTTPEPLRFHMELSEDSDEGLAFPGPTIVIRLDMTSNYPVHISQIPFTFNVTDFAATNWDSYYRLADAERYTLWITEDGEHSLILHPEWTFDIMEDGQFGYAFASPDLSLEANHEYCLWMLFDAFGDGSGPSTILDDEIRVDVEQYTEFVWTDHEGYEHTGYTVIGFPVYGYVNYW